jgi:transcriptional regulator with XRE-family HTH domain
MARILIKKSKAIRALERLCGGPLTFGQALVAIRKCDEIPQDACARRLKISKSHLCDIEKGRKTVSPERAAKWAAILGYPESVFVQLAIQAELDAAGLNYRVAIEAT